MMKEKEMMVSEKIKRIMHEGINGKKVKKNQENGFFSETGHQWFQSPHASGITQRPSLRLRSYGY